MEEHATSSFLPSNSLLFYIAIREIEEIVKENEKEQSKKEEIEEKEILDVKKPVEFPCKFSFSLF